MRYSDLSNNQKTFQQLAAAQKLALFKFYAIETSDQQELQHTRTTVSVNLTKNQNQC